MITPNTTLILIKNVPFDNTYEHTVSYASRTAQHNDLVSGNEGTDYFTFGAMTYQRSGKNTIRVEKSIDGILACNYMCWKNSSYENKWWYAFITHMEYINDVTTEITYEVDVIQTFFLFDTIKEKSFVEREHTATDEIGGNIVPEPVALGEYVFDSYDKLTDIYDDMCVVIATVDVTEDEQVAVKTYDGGVSGETLHAFRVINVEETGTAIKNFLKDYISKPEAVTAMYLCPTELLPDETLNTYIIPEGSSGKNTDIYMGYFTGEDTEGNPLTFEGYVPKNKKLYTYPYNYLHVDNCAGNALALRYEFFDGSRPAFRIFTNFTYPVSLNLVPYQYKGQSNTSTYNRTEKLTVSNFPLCSWANDSYSNWVSTQSVPNALGAISPLLQLGTGAISLATGNPMGVAQVAGGLESSLNYVTNLVSQSYTASIKADVLRGSASSGNANVRVNENTFHRGRACITAQYAEIIDNFFSMYGYAVNRLKEIEIRNRSHWTYVKTAGANLNGSCGHEYTRKMVTILDKGITFWKDSKRNVCNYSLENNTL